MFSSNSSGKTRYSKKHSGTRLVPLTRQYNAPIFTDNYRGVLMADNHTDAKFSLRLSGGGINLEREIDRDVALRVLSIVMGGAARAPSPNASDKSRTVDCADQAPISLSDYLDDVQAVRKPDQIVTIAYFICEHEGAEDFDRDEIKSRFSSAREPLPANFGRDFTWTLKNRWIAKAHGKNGRYYVTTKGIQAVESRFSSEVKKATASTKFTARRRRKGMDTESVED